MKYQLILSLLPDSFFFTCKIILLLILSLWPPPTLCSLGLSSFCWKCSFYIQFAFLVSFPVYVSRIIREQRQRGKAWVPVRDCLQLLRFAWRKAAGNPQNSNCRSHSGDTQNVSRMLADKDGDSVGTFEGHRNKEKTKRKEGKEREGAREGEKKEGEEERMKGKKGGREGGREIISSTHACYWHFIKYTRTLRNFVNNRAETSKSILLVIS